MTDIKKLKSDIKKWSIELGFDQMGVSGIEVKNDEVKLIQWLKNNHHGSMKYMEKHGKKRARPNELIPGALRVISFRMTYHFFDKELSEKRLKDGKKAYIANYALGRDYHKTIRSKLKQIISRISDHSNIKEKNYFVDSAPVLERALARNAGLGWIGKNTNLINKNHGSWFFIAEIITDIELEIDQPSTNHCGSCNECIDVCPTSAIIAPYELDARKCISYLTIENKESIPKEFREPIGNRIFGCDDCQIFCPWNKFAKTSLIDDFMPRDVFEDASLIREQADRCRDILRSMGRSGKTDLHLRAAPISDIIREAAEPHQGRGVIIQTTFDCVEEMETPQPIIQRRPEIIHGLRNMIQNAVDFGTSKVSIQVTWSKDRLIINILDDGPGFSMSILDRIGDPFMGTRKPENDGILRPEYEGMGLGLFIAKTLLERTGAELNFSNGAANNSDSEKKSYSQGALVVITWPLRLIEQKTGALGANEALVV